MVTSAYLTDLGEGTPGTSPATVRTCRAGGCKLEVYPVRNPHGREGCRDGRASGACDLLIPLPVTPEAVCRRHIEALARGGQTVPAYARAHGLKPDTLYRCRRRFPVPLAAPLRGA